MPSWVASYLWTLSGGRIDQETEWFLRWVLPLKRGYQYYHAALIENGRKTVSRSDTILSRFEKFRAMIAGNSKGK